MAEFSHRSTSGGLDAFFAELDESVDSVATEQPPALELRAGTGVAESQQQLFAGSSDSAPLVALQSNNPFRPHYTPRQTHALESSSPLKSPSSPLLTLRQATQAERQRSLGDYFVIGEVQNEKYTDQDLANIARLLKESGRELESSAPRIYTVLRRIGQIPALGAFLDQGMNDL